MILKWWSVGLIVVLGLVWFVLAEHSTPDETRLPAVAAVSEPMASPAGPRPVVPNPAALQAVAPVRGPLTPPVADVPAASTPAAAVPAAAARPAEQAPASNEAAGAVATPRDASPLLSAPVRALIDQASAQATAGDRAGAESSLRQAMQRAGTAAEAARAGLRLAPLTADLLERRRLLSAALLDDVVMGREYDEVGRQLRELNRSPGGTLQAALALEEYVVAPNDSLWKLCNKVFPAKFRATPEVGLIRLVNGLSSDTLRVGQVLKVPTDPLRLTVSMQNHGLTAFVGDTAVAAYWIGLGKENRTPRDTFVVDVKQENPAWFNGRETIPFGDPENVLGTRWMGFAAKPGATGFGIHGTAHPESIGLDESMGCVRMRNAEVEELFEVVPRGTSVTIG